jgi:hypothetical protein
MRERRRRGDYKPAIITIAKTSTKSSQKDPEGNGS